MKRRILFAVAFAALGLSVTSGRSADPNKVAPFMRLKLAHSEKLLEGIALADFPLIEKSAQALSVQSRDEMWQVLQTADYLQHSIEFRRSADRVAAAAKKKNIDAAAFAYVGLTMQCVNCHKHVRDVRTAGLDVPASIHLGQR
ncbi:MAG: hypothetical protein K8U03_19170 [Planctomycetia bacterium]|nr:hypothetical protein [Planctomycetia bacterium]